VFRDARRLGWLFCFVLLAAALTADVAYSAPPSSAPGYLADDYGTLALASNTDMAPSKVVDKGFPVTVISKPRPELDAPIWAVHCRASAQTATFTRTVWLPGPPNVGGSFEFEPWIGRAEFGAVTSIDVFVNGQLIVHQRVPAQGGAGGPRGVVRVPLDAGAMKAFRFEQNTVQVRVSKRATRGRCNTRNPATRVGIQFMLAGHFGTDLALNPPAVVYYKLDPGHSFYGEASLNFRNDGPGWEPTGKFQVNFIGPPQVVLGSGGGLPPPGPPLTNCQLSDNGVSHVVTCGLSDFAPATAGSLHLFYKVQAPSSDYSDFSVSLQWSIGAGGVQDMNASNNLSNATVFFCGPQSTKPGCQTAIVPPP
jgi:hypothetical protein